METIHWDAVTEEAVRHLQSLLQIDTTNPPGNERAAAEFLADILTAEGFEVTILESAPGRGNLITRLKGDGSEPPLLLYSHTDVVPVEAERWRYPPFGGEIHDGYIYGRGAVDMKGIVAMQLMTMLLLKRTATPLRRDVIFAATADEEMAGVYGMGWLVDNHPELIRAEYALSEFGGFSVTLGTRRFYLCQTAEKGLCWLRLRAQGRPGHASVPHDRNAVVRLAEAVARLGRAKLPLHVTPTVREFVHGIAEAQEGEGREALLGLLDPQRSDAVLERVLSDSWLRYNFYAMLHNTATPTGLRAESKTNVIPSTAEAIVDGRTLPGQTQESFLQEVRAVIGDEVEVEVTLAARPLEFPTDTPLFRTMRRTLQQHDPDAVVVPMLLTGATDAKHVARLGTVCYGFSPMRLPPGEDFMARVHGHDERLAIETLAFGVRVLFDTVRAFCGRKEA